jgi:hypothetical protein
VGTLTTGTWNAATIGEVYGGTGQTTYATGDILYASMANTLSRLGTGGASSGQVLTLSSSAPLVPTWASANAHNHDAGAITTGTLNDARLSANVAMTNASNAFGAFTQTFDGNTLVVNATTSRVGIGAASPTTMLEVQGGALTAVMGVSTGANVYGVYGYSNSTTGNAVRGWNNSDGYAGYFYNTNGGTQYAVRVDGGGAGDPGLYVDGTTRMSGQLVSSVGIGTAPISVTTSTSLCTNLNADLVDNLHASDLLRSNTSDTFTSGVLATSAGTTLDVNGTLRIDSPNGSVLRNGTQVDFAGAANNDSGTNVNLGAGWTNIGTVQITPPANGYVLVTAGGYVAANPAAGQSISWGVGLYANATTVYTYSIRQVNMTVGAAGLVRLPFQTTWRFSVSGGTTYTFYLNGNASTTGSPYCDQWRMEAIYIPRNY